MILTKQMAVELWQQFVAIGEQEEFRRIVNFYGVDKMFQLEAEKRAECFLYLADLLAGVKQIMRERENG